MSLSKGVELNVVDARWISGYQLEISFSDGFTRLINFEPFLRGSMHAEIRKYLDINRFKEFEIRFGNLVWNEYDLCFSIEHLYSGAIGASGDIQSMVAEGSADYGVSDTQDDDLEIKENRDGI